MDTKREESEALLSDDETITPSEDGTSTRDANRYEPSKEKKGWSRSILQRINFPFSVLFIVGNEFCERFSYYGMRAVLVLFLNTQLKFTEDSSTAIYHAFIMLCYLLPLLGAVISDSCLGKYLTILSLSVVYALGNVLVSVSAIPFSIGGEIALAAIGLIVIALGTGGIKPCVSAFGGDQFKEGQTDNLRRFFSLFYFSINAGSVISTLLTPVLRNYVNCFNTCQCFALAFGVPAVLMVISLVIFIVGTKFYVIKKPRREHAMLYLNVPWSITTAVYRRFKYGKSPDKAHILQYAVPKFSAQFMEDVRLFLRVLVMLLPLPIFWALFDQQGSRWTLQATRMNGQLGALTVQPDQMQALNPVLILVFIPIFEIVVYPIFSKCHLLKKPLQRMVVGMGVAGLAFVAAGFIQLAVQNAAVNLKEGESKLILVNTLPQRMQFNVTSNTANVTIGYDLDPGESNVTTGFQFGQYSLDLPDYAPLSFDLDNQNITQIVFALNSSGSIVLLSDEFEDKPVDGGKSSIQVISTLDETSDVLDFQLTREGTSPDECAGASFNASYLAPLETSQRDEVEIGKYDYIIRNSTNGTEMGSVQEFYGGATYTLIVSRDQSGDMRLYNVTVVEVDPPNSVSMFLQIPMYVLITAGEVMFSVTGLEFAYSQAPVSMKAMCQAAWLMTVAFGNLVVIIIAEARIFEDQAIEFFFFAILIFVLTILFAVMAFFYKYVDLNQKPEAVNDETDDSGELTPDESSALILEKSNMDESERTVGGYVTGSDLDLDYETTTSKSMVSSDEF